MALPIDEAIMNSWCQLLVWSYLVVTITGFNYLFIHLVYSLGFVRPLGAPGGGSREPPGGSPGASRDSNCLDAANGSVFLEIVNTRRTFANK